MNRAQRKLVRMFSIISAFLLAAATSILAYALNQARAAHHGDIFDRIVADKAFAWIEPTLVCITGAFFVALVLFVGFWKSFGGDEPRRNG
jgi:fructose-specific phosphotransferase system IIC component